MDHEKYIPVSELCSRYEIEVSFVRDLEDHGLLRIAHDSGAECLEVDLLGDFERLVRLHYDLEINLAGIEAIHHLLEKVREMHLELARLRNRSGGGIGE